MNISQAAKSSGLPARTIRYYESLGLTRAAPRDGNGYRRYDQRHLGELRLLHRLREVGFSLEECRQVVALYRDQHRRSHQVRGLVLEKCEVMELRIGQLRSMQQVLQGLAQRCSGDEGPECAILDELERAD